MDSYSPPPQQPPQPPPPVIRAAPPPPPRPRGGAPWKVLAIVFVVVGVLFFLALLPAFMGGGSRANLNGRYLEEVVLENNRSPHKIAVVDISGIITGQSIDRGRSLVEHISDQLTIAARDPRVKSVLVRINSPGGEVLASDEIYHAILDFRQQAQKPVVAYLGSLAASGGYYVAAPCTLIVANELSITGSIGVIMNAYNYRGLMNKVGLRPQTFKSGQFKDMLSGARDLDQLTPEEEQQLVEERQMVQQIIDETHETFKNAVKTGRDQPGRLAIQQARPLAMDWANYADGRIFSGRQAYELGYVDHLGNFESAVALSQQLAGIEDANLVQYQQPFTLGNLFRIFGQSDAKSIKVDFGMDFPKLQPGYLYFLTPTVVR
jgi:protease IV